MRFFPTRFELTTWKRWLGAGCVIGVGMVLSEATFEFSPKLEDHLRVYSGDAEYRSGLPASHELAFLVCVSAAVASWSWISGFALGSLSGNATWFTGALLYLVVNNSYLILIGSVRWGSPHAPGLPLFLVDMFLPRIGPTFALFVFPALFGLESGSRYRSLSARPSALIPISMLAMTAVLSWMSGWYQVSRAWGAPTFSGRTALLSLPLVYMVLTARRMTAACLPDIMGA